MTTWLFAAAAVACLVLRWTVLERHFDATPLLFALAPYNAMTFSMRRALAWTRGAVRLSDEPKERLFEGALAVKEQGLRDRYRLGPLYERSTTYVYRENLYVLDLLERHGPRLAGRTSIRAIDVGSKDFRYAFGLARWLRSSSREVSLTGLELDGYPMYPDLHSRREHGEAYAAQVDDADVRYAVADFLTHEEAEVDVLFFFFPFVLEYALLRWGLPRRCFVPICLFEHAYRMLRPGGVVVVMNHTEEERLRQIELLEASGFEVTTSERSQCDLVDYANEVPERSMTIARRRASSAGE